MSITIRYDQEKDLVFVNGRKFVPEPPIVLHDVCSVCDKKITDIQSIVYLRDGKAHTECLIDVAFNRKEN